MYGGGEDKREVMRKMEIVKITVNSNRGIKTGTMEPIADILSCPWYAFGHHFAGSKPSGFSSPGGGGGRTRCEEFSSRVVASL